ncbi:cytochrome c biogenesis CcdA family protein [Dermatophilus congolensis]|uniref:Thiol:disulfide interchange protein n=1 Tax=Dermatophilus congolensis TaxID=1863 RepID=A0A239VAY6_9MICO|nr:cytochrome c biogenesis CcdA family protein [Dermatophilus congolensis]MBO3128461.1 cytochrome c biogenesis protein CcdA [Dermatophilus congolensis]MBO3132900.1 cytochrome c biogenesis protein CcdA [Dermatophilus congolensis]MBO3132941.1 cytochrome c biogenesis protein CcdA [Dermatophilus congolensis]MBO3135178.1 cytochrome c biogenesis protein CcdA [Dermatophilus congolensis]MBO3137416.1 cytochrome c biogenesis protein CcdA [Dermatophilus congolensis]
MTDLTQVLADGNLLLALAISLAAGSISFASPCVLPLVPGFLGYVGGIAHTTNTPNQPTPIRNRTLLGAALFVLGFSTVFITGTLLASAAGAALHNYTPWLTRLGGIIIIALALIFLGFGTQRTYTPTWRPRTGLAGAPLLGIIFGLGWAPCMGPTYAVIYALATNLAGDTGLITRGALLGIAYCAGLGIPFLLIAAGWQHALTASTWLRRHQHAIHIAGGLLLLTVGLLLLTGAWDTIVHYLQTTLVNRFQTAL